VFRLSGLVPYRTRQAGFVMGSLLAVVLGVQPRPTLACSEVPFDSYVEIMPADGLLPVNGRIIVSLSGMVARDGRWQRLYPVLRNAWSTIPLEIERSWEMWSVRYLVLSPMIEPGIGESFVFALTTEPILSKSLRWTRPIRIVPRQSPDRWFGPGQVGGWFTHIEEPASVGVPFLQIGVTSDPSSTFYYTLTPGPWEVSPLIWPAQKASHLGTVLTNLRFVCGGSWMVGPKGRRMQLVAIDDLGEVRAADQDVVVWLPSSAEFAWLPSRLEPACLGSVRGVVEDVSGEPVTQAQIELLHEHEMGTDLPLFHAKSNDHGEFLRPGLPCGRWKVRTPGTKGLAPVQSFVEVSDHSISEVRLVSGKGREIRGRILDAARRSARGWDIRGYSVESNTFRRATSGRNGGFEITGLPDEDVLIYARPPSDRSIADELLIGEPVEGRAHAGDRDVVLAAPALSTFHMRVEGLGAELPQQVLLRVTSAEGGDPGPPQHEILVPIPPNGRGSLSLRTKGKVLVSMAASQLRASVTIDPDIQRTIDLQLSEDVGFSGRVRDAHRRPLAGVLVDRWSHHEDDLVVTDGMGRFRGKSLRLSGQGHRERTTMSLRVPGSAVLRWKRIQREILIPRSGAIVGRIQKGGRPVFPAEIFVRVQDPDFEADAHVLVDAEGGFRTPLMPSGNYLVEIRPRSEALGSLGFDGRTEPLRFRLKASSVNSSRSAELVSDGNSFKLELRHELGD
jgi:hypothetical protein